MASCQINLKLTKTQDNYEGKQVADFWANVFEDHGRESFWYSDTHFFCYPHMTPSSFLNTEL